MGIQGLLPLLKSIMVPIHIKDLEGCSVAIDTYSWLHKGALSCSKELCKGQPTSKHINYCMHRVNLLRHHGVKPILVFDGGFLPMKSDQENKRARSRKENLARAIEHESCGNSSAAYEYYQKAVDISPSIAYDLIQVLKQENVSYVVAPYEADAQMTFLAVTKQVDAVITEDSDLIAFGCPRIIYKMDKFGQGVEFRYSTLQQNKELNFTGFTKQMLLEMCVFSGCDYLQSLPGMGLKKAHALVKKFKSYDMVIRHLKYNTIAVPPLYEESFKKAILTFQHQRVYDPVIQDIVHLSDPSEDIGEDSDFLGPTMPQHIVKGIASGDIDPLTKVPFQGESSKSSPALDETYQLKNFKKGVEKKKLDLPAQKNLLTNYFCFATLEAKRKFRVPRITPKHPNSNSGTPSSVEDIDEENNSCSPATLVDTENYADVALNEHHVDNGVSSRALTHVGPLEDNVSGDTRKHQQTSLQQHGCSIHPCVESLKGQECNFTSNGGECKIRMENKKVIVRSLYFQKRSTNDDVTATNESTVPGIKCKSTLTEGENDVEKTNDHISVERKTRGEKRKGITRSSYFQHDSSKEDDKENGNDIVSPNYSAASDTFEDIIPTENLNHKFLRTNESYPIPSVINSDLENDGLADRESEQQKFGCNISHLGQYSEIAEKSMEKFVSVISSFKCSSGSRASGLRAPLKDVKNICTRNRLNEGLDLNKFTYVPPTNRKVSSLSRRRKNI